MQAIEFACPSIGPLKIFGDRLHNGQDFLVRSNSKSTTLDYLIFYDAVHFTPRGNQVVFERLIEFL